LSQKDLAKLLKTFQQQISRLESPGYEGHSLSMLRRVADVLHAKVRVVFEPAETKSSMRVAAPPGIMESSVGSRGGNQEGRGRDLMCQLYVLNKGVT